MREPMQVEHEGWGGALLCGALLVLFMVAVFVLGDFFDHVRAAVQ